MDTTKIEASYNWILNCIESSSNIFQFRCCNTIVGLFEVMYKEEENAKQRIASLKETLDAQEIKCSLDA